MVITLPSWFPIIGLFIACLALILAYKNYKRKSGLLLRGNFGVGFHADSADAYVASVIIENLKDRSITTFGIYLKVGHNYYIELENFKDKPLVLKAFESYHKEYGPIQFYGSNSVKINLNYLLRNHKIRKTLVLSTGDGKYTIPKPIRAWDPVSEYFNNLKTVIAHPLILRYGEHYVGGNIDYVVDIAGPGNKNEVVMLTKDSYKRSIFKDFSLTKESLESKENLEKFLVDQIDARQLESQFTVYETSQWKANADQSYRQKYDAPTVGWIDYYVVGRLSTLFDDMLTRFKNRKRT